ncbi:MAG: DNA repair protein RecN, partial [Alphaproteobacteria bacterium]
ETGAGKSILLDCLGQALGGRADAALLRPGAEQATISALFQIDDEHAACRNAREAGLHVEDGMLLLRRTLSRDGRTRAYVNDQTVSVGLLRDIGDSLAEIQGQFEQHGLLDETGHAAVLDAFGGHQAELATTAAAWRAWRDAVRTAADAVGRTNQSRQDAAFLAESIADLTDLDPQPDEETALADARRRLQNRDRLVAGLTQALDAVAGAGRAEESLHVAARAIATIRTDAGVAGQALLDAVDRAIAEAAEVRSGLESLASGLDDDDQSLEAIEERLFALRAAARKHGTEVAGLSDLRRTMQERLALLDTADEERERLERAAATARAAYLTAAGALTTARRSAAQALDTAVAAELPPLKLERTRFVTSVGPLKSGDGNSGAGDGGDDSGDGAADGRDRVCFLAATNDGDVPASLRRVASGGELARFLLALKVVLHHADEGRSLIFDEVDAGIGGAVAAAVGERLAGLAATRQILVVTHSPQVASAADRHLRVRKEVKGGATRTLVTVLDDAGRREEIARMLSGRKVTEEARAQADRLLERVRPRRPTARTAQSA